MSGRRAKKRKGQKPQKFCFKHATRVARRQCFECQRPICPKCQMRLSGHIFCTLTCHTRHQGALRRENFREWRNRLLQNPMLRGAVIGAFGMLAMTVIYLSFKVADESTPVQAFEAPVILPADEPQGLQLEDADFTLPGLVDLKEPADRMETNAPYVEKVAGLAPPGAIVGLYLNDTLIDMALAEDGAFAFEKVALSQEINSLQVRYYDRYGTSAYSNARLVIYTGNRPKKIRPIHITDKPQKRSPAPNHFVRGDRNQNTVFLTFDGGSSNNCVDEILKALDQHNAKCTFFLTGQFIEKFPREVLKILQGGHEIGNHTYNHPHLTTYLATKRHGTLKGVTQTFFNRQMQRTEAIYEELTGQPLAPLWRAPFGEHNRQIRGWAEDMGYMHIGWSSGHDTLDWVEDPKHHLFLTPQQLRHKLGNFASRRKGNANGVVVLMHLGLERKPEDRPSRILTDIMSDYEQSGYRFGKISDQALKAQVKRDEL